MLILAGLAAYHNSFQGPFIFDDKSTIPENPHIRSLWPIWHAMRAPQGKTGSGRPVLCLSLAVNYGTNTRLGLSGLDVRIYHATNLAIHLAAALLLFGIVRRTLVTWRLRDTFAQHSTLLAGICALVWVVHPLHTESVTYVIQRAESLMGLFFLLTMYCAVRGFSSQQPRRWYAAAVICCAAGMGTKEVMVTAPVIVLLYDRIFAGRSLKDILRRRWGLYAGLGLCWLVLAGLLATNPRSASAGFGVQPVTPLAYAMTQCQVILHYLRLSVWPHPLVLDYTWPVARSFSEVAFHAAGMAALLVGAVAALRYRPALGFAAAWFFVILASTSSFVPIVDPAFEHRMYLPLAGTVAGVVCLCFLAGRWMASRTRSSGAFTVLGVAACLAATGALTVLTVRRNDDYRSALAIWNDTLAKRPHNVRAYNNRAMAFEELGRYDQAISDYSFAIELRPRCAVYYYGRGNAYLAKGLSQEAIRNFSAAISLDPDLHEAYSNRGIALTNQGRLDLAITDFKRAIELEPGYENAYCNRAIAYGRMGLQDLAIADCNKAIELDANYAKAFNNRGLAYSAKGLHGAAIRDFTKAIKLDGEFAEAYGARGAAYLTAGEYRKAIADFETALRLNPADRVARRNRDTALKLLAERAGPRAP